MAMKDETKYYVLLGKFASAFNNSSVLSYGNYSFNKDSDESGDTVRFFCFVNNKTFSIEYPISTTKTEQDILDELMGLYNVTD